MDDKIAKLQIWETAGQERFKTITSAYYRGADGVFVVFDKSSSLSFQHVNVWLDEIKKHAEVGVKVLVGNKDDVGDAAEVSEQEALKLAEAEGMQYIETSALSSHHVISAFELITKELITKKTSQIPRGDQLRASIVNKNQCC